jgi:hypothetical protein
MKDMPPALKTNAKILRVMRLAQPKVTLHQAQMQAVRVMAAGKRSPLRLVHSSLGAKSST